MPFFSFILEENYTPVSLGIIDSNLKLLKKKKRYFSKNTKLWNILNKKNNEIKISKLSIEKHSKVNNHIKKVIFCLPPSVGVGDSVEYALAIKAIERKKLFEKVGLAFCSKTYSILSQFINIKNIYSDFISEDEINKYDGIFHFTSEIKSLKLQKYYRENIEDSIINHFNVQRFRPKINKSKKKISTISIFPISKSPIRTLPTSLVNNIINYLNNKNYLVELILDYDSIISELFIEKLNLDNINVIIPKNILDLNDYIKRIEYGIFCDSGPLHLSKIYRKKGLLISTSVGSKKIISNQDDLLCYNSNYKSLYCEAPCGLTNIINLKNNHGCYDSLKKDKKHVVNSANFNMLNRGNLQKSYGYFIQNPVGCVRTIDFEKIKLLIDQISN